MPNPAPLITKVGSVWCKSYNKKGEKKIDRFLALPRVRTYVRTYVKNGLCRDRDGVVLADLLARRNCCSTSCWDEDDRHEEYME